MNDDRRWGDKDSAESLAMDEASRNPGMSEHASRYLDEQTAWSRAQREHLERTAALQIENLKRQSRMLRAQHAQYRAQRLHEHMRTIYQSVLSLVALAIFAVIVYGVFKAITDQSVVVHQFEVPPDLAAAGTNGTVVASEFLDQLHYLQVATRSHQSSLIVNDAWSNDIQLQVPDVHVTIGDIRRNLYNWLGHEIQINGDVVEQGSQITLTVRGTDFVAKSFQGPRTTLPALLTEAAEYVYGQAETYNFANYLEEHGRDADAIALVQKAFPSASPKDRPWLLNAWGNGLTDLNQNAPATDKYREAIRLDPRFWVAYANLENAQMELGEQEAAYQTGIKFEHGAKRGSWFAAKVPEMYYTNTDQLRMDLPAVNRELVADENTHGGVGTLTETDAPLDAEMLARMHADRQARFVLQTSPGAGSNHYVMAEAAFVEGLIALDQQNYGQAANEFETLGSMLAQDSTLVNDFTMPPTCYLALAEEFAGHPDKADAAIAKGGRFVDCYRFKADISDHRGEWAQAQKEYAAAVALAPSLPQAYESWGEALMRHGDFKSAIVEFEEANQRGPHWCDPLERWGQALAAEGNYSGAVKEYSEASKYTPGWGALELYWGQALDKLGKHVAALQHYRTAQETGDLTVAEGVMLAKLLPRGS